MSDDKQPTVTVGTAPGIHGQFGKSLIYQRGKNTSKQAAWICGFALVGILGLAVIVRPNDDFRPEDTSSIPLPEIVENAAPTVTLPKYEPKREQTDSLRAKRTKPLKVLAQSSPLEKMAGPELLSRPRGIPIPPGSMIEATLVSGASNGPIKASVSRPLIVNGETLIDSGTTLLGMGTSSQERLFVRFNKLVFQDGTFEDVQAEAIDGGDKIAGLKGSKIGGMGLKLAAGIALNVLGGMSAGLQDQDVVHGVAVQKPSLKNALLNGTGKAAVDESREFMNDVHSQQPIIEVPEGSTIFVIFGG